jgi:hypothetical protein
MNCTFLKKEVQFFMRKIKPKTYRDLGLTESEFLEAVDFFKELMRLDQRAQAREKLVLVCRGRLRNLIEQKKKDLLEQIRRLEKLS